ncbi:MAG: hypothetical protein CL610_12190 [Anaerolineaceae bacterium]|nr:hypothetical protein [Anaerolineaceae bacterium]
MNLEQLTTEMQHNARRIQAMVDGVGDEQARWKPDAETWSVLEVVNHLYDEERHDFRTRLDYILHKPGEPWPANRPQEWVTERRYNERDLHESLQNFLDERQQSMDWLQSLTDIDWERSETAPWGATMSAGTMFASWVAHDVLHLRQLAELHREWIVRQSEPYSTYYAGEW